MRYPVSMKSSIDRSQRINMNILITNVHSAKNLGDDAIMQVTLVGIKSKYPTARITIAANDPESWKKYSDLEVVNSLCSWVGDCRYGQFRKGLVFMPFVILYLFLAAILYRSTRVKFNLGRGEKSKLLSAYYQSDLVLICGGGNLYSHRSASPALIWGLITVAFAIGLGKRTVMLPQSVGPIAGKAQRWLSRLVLNHVSHIMVREAISKNFIENSLGVSSEVLLMPDMAFGLPYKSCDFPDLQPGQGLKVGVTVIDRGAQEKTFLHQQDYERSLISTISQLITEQNAQINFFIQCKGPSPDQNDALVTNRLITLLDKYDESIRIHDDIQDAIQLRQEFDNMVFIIGTRMHTGIIGFSVGVPILLISYQPKSAGIMELMNLSRYCLDIEHITPQILGKLIDDMINENKEIRARITKHYQQIHLAANNWLNSI